MPSVFFARLGDVTLEKLVGSGDEIGPAQPVHDLRLGVGGGPPARQDACQPAGSCGKRASGRKLQGLASTDLGHGCLPCCVKWPSTAREIAVRLGVEEMPVGIDCETHFRAPGRHGRAQPKQPSSSALGWTAWGRPRRAQLSGLMRNAIALMLLLPCPWRQMPGLHQVTNLPHRQTATGKIKASSW